MGACFSAYDEYEADAARGNALAAMLKVEGFDVIIICCGTAHQAAFWQARLARGRGVVVPEEATILCVHEDWEGGAGNGLGTLYAWTKAANLAEKNGDADLAAKLASGDLSAALYHTAGKGTRLAPLPGAENNNKPGVKLPATAPLGIDQAQVPLTILESVVKSTGIFAASRKGRLSVFWGDQVFVPTKTYEYDAARAHADILCMLAPMPSASEWKQKGLDKYGLVCVTKSGAACQIEKVDHATAKSMTRSLGSIAQVGTSLGSFSLTASLLSALLTEFGPELKRKKGCLDSDPHWWMPMTLPLDAYVTMMGQKGTSSKDATAHFNRIEKLLAGFDLGGAHLLGPVDVGGDAYWWDYGQLKLYLRNAVRLVEDGKEADAMREFLSVKRGDKGLCGEAFGIDAYSTASSCRIAEGAAKRSVLASVDAIRVEAEGAVLVNVTASSIRAGEGAIAYNVVEAGELVLKPGEVCSDVFAEDGSKLRQRSTLETDGGTKWKVRQSGNTKTFEEVYKANLSTNVIEASRAGAAAHAAQYVSSTEAAAKAVVDAQAAEDARCAEEAAEVAEIVNTTLGCARGSD
jgi:hypothetical protein